MFNRSNDLSSRRFRIILASVMGLGRALTLGLCSAPLVWALGCGSSSDHPAFVSGESGAGAEGGRASAGGGHTASGGSTHAGGSAGSAGSAGRAGSGGSGVVGTGGSNAGAGGHGGLGGSAALGGTTSIGQGGEAGADVTVDPNCNTVVDQGQFVTTTHDEAAAPVPTHGTIIPGTYVLTSNIEYGGALYGGTVDSTGEITVSGSVGTLQFLDKSMAPGALGYLSSRESVRLEMAPVTSDPPVSIMFLCATGVNAELVGLEVSSGYDYSATETSLTITVTVADADHIVSTYPKLCPNAAARRQ